MMDYRNLSQILFHIEMNISIHPDYCNQGDSMVALSTFTTVFLVVFLDVYFDDSRCSENGRPGEGCLDPFVSNFREGSLRAS